MAIQKRFLISRGFEVEQSDAYPALKSEDFPRALEQIFNNRVEGWWNLERDFARHGVCTSEEFSQALQTTR